MQPVFLCGSKRLDRGLLQPLVRSGLKDGRKSRPLFVYSLIWLPLEARRPSGARTRESGAAKGDGRRSQTAADLEVTGSATANVWGRALRGRSQGLWSQSRRTVGLQVFGVSDGEWRRRGWSDLTQQRGGSRSPPVSSSSSSSSSSPSCSQERQPAVFLVFIKQEVKWPERPGPVFRHQRSRAQLGPGAHCSLSGNYRGLFLFLLPNSV